MALKTTARSVAAPRPDRDKRDRRTDIDRQRAAFAGVHELRVCGCELTEEKTW